METMDKIKYILWYTMDSQIPLRSTRKSSRKGSSKSTDAKVLKEIATLKKDVKNLKKENKRLDRHIDAIYNDNNNMAQSVAGLVSEISGHEVEIIIIKKTMKEKLNINWRRIEEGS